MDKQAINKQLKRRDSIKSEFSDSSEISGTDLLDRIDLDVSNSIQGFVFHSSKLAETIEIFDRLWLHFIIDTKIYLFREPPP